MILIIIISLILAKLFSMTVNRKLGSVLIVLGFMGLGLFLARPAQALSPAISQVKIPSGRTVYYLNHATHLRKAYINADAFLGYGNKWSSVKLISPEEMAKWVDARLLKTAEAPAVYYILGSQKTLILFEDDLQAYNLNKEPILTVNQSDLDTYQSVSNTELGLIKTEAEIASVTPAGVATSTPLAGSTLTVSLTPLNNGANNSILAGTNSNLIGLINLQAGSQDVAVNVLKIDLTGVYNSDLVDRAYITLEDNKVIERYSHYSASSRQLEVNFPDQPLVINANQTRSVKVKLNLKPCDLNCNNQTIRVELKSPDNIKSNANLNAAWPLSSDYFKILNVPSLIAQPVFQEEALAADPSGPNLILGKFTLSENSGSEDVYLKELTLVNNASLNIQDLKNFRLQTANSIISRVSEIRSGDKIVFSINYCRVSKEAPVTLTVLAQKGENFHPGGLTNLDVDGAWLVGKNLSVSLTPTINNISEVKTIN